MDLVVNIYNSRQSNCRSKCVGQVPLIGPLICEYPLIDAHLRRICQSVYLDKKQHCSVFTIS